ncbi:OmpA family protein [Qipengyuania spongiae]|uniref:OmpA family protein n=1 Tax=Qipengyuania spongiae TaxID=2909673 RepID=A0ABY5SU27_9SPHN|nr:OmpA family protein [Qipengyuania spongiae]UVI38083.1 OmpA family protein [Qipengyuania spongiae]
MRIYTMGASAVALVAVSAAPLTAQQYDAQPGEEVIVTGNIPADLSGMEEGPDVEGVISAREGDRIEIVSDDGTRRVVAISPATEIRSSGGFLGLAREDLRSTQLLNGIPVEIDTVQWGGGSLIASKVSLKSRDLRTAQMIHNATDQRFTANEAATEALRGRVANIDDYNVKGVTNVYFDTNEYDLSDEARANLCSAAQQASATDNALLLVVGYTDSTGTYEINQDLSEKRATRVVNYLQQQCGWQPYRMMTPTGMAEADPAADNTTEYGKAQNRRVAVNILVSKSVDGI